MLTEMMKLIDTTLKLIDAKSQLNKAYFEQFIQPTWEAFAKIHEDYLTSFRDYKNIATKENIQISELIETIRQDSLHSIHTRDQLRNMIQHLPPAKMKANQSDLYYLIQAISEYFGIHLSFSRTQRNDLSNTHSDQAVGVHYTPTDLKFFYINAPRYRSIIHLARKSAIDENTNEMFDAITKDLQNAYNHVADSYYQIRKNLFS